jgi:hypothetical protein
MLDEGRYRFQVALEGAWCGTGGLGSWGGAPGTDTAPAAYHKPYHGGYHATYVAAAGARSNAAAFARVRYHGLFADTLKCRHSNAIYFMSV